MAEVKKKLLGNERRRKYRSDGAPAEKTGIEGPGIWVSCIKGKEKQTVGELYDVFESLTDELWPEGNTGSGEQEVGSTAEDLSLEAQIAKEMLSMRRPRRQKRFVNCQTNTPCVVFISCRSPVDPVQLVVKHIENIQRTGVTHTRYTHRLVPVSGTCIATLPEIGSLCGKVFTPFFEGHGERKFTYKVELRIRNHSTLSRLALIQHVAQCMPTGHRVSLENPEIFILVEVFKNTCGISIVQDYYRLQKFNVMEISNAKQLSEPSEAKSRVPM